MYKKLISIILVIAFLNLLGCASIQSFTVSEYRQIDGKDEKPDEISVITKDGQEFDFIEPILTFGRDTLYVNGMITNHSGPGRYLQTQQVDRNFALTEIESIQSNTILFSETSFLLVLAICGSIYLIISAATADVYKGKVSLK